MNDLMPLLQAGAVQSAHVPLAYSSLPSFASSSPALQSVTRIGNHPECLNLHPDIKYTDRTGKGHGKTLSRIRTTFRSGLRSIRKFNLSINTHYLNVLGSQGLSTQEKQKAIMISSLIFAKGEFVGNKDDNQALQFYLSKNVGDFRVELAHRNYLGINTDSLYKFRMRVGYSAENVIFFQLKEEGGRMKTLIGGRPVMSLHLVEGKKIVLRTNNEARQGVKSVIATLSCPQHWYAFKVRVLWPRSKPLIQVFINGYKVFEDAIHFGSENARGHYSKFGIYIPQQKNLGGKADTSLLFDDVQEIHRRA